MGEPSLLLLLSIEGLNTPTGLDTTGEELTLLRAKAAPGEVEFTVDNAGFTEFIRLAALGPAN